MSNKSLQKLQQMLKGKKKKKPVAPSARVMALQGRKHFSSGGDSMIKQAQSDYNGSYISGDLGGVKVGNKSYAKYYKGMLS